MRHFDKLLSEALEAPDNDEDEFGELVDFNEAVHELLRSLDTENPKYLTTKEMLRLWTIYMPDGWADDEGDLCWAVGRESTGEEATICFHTAFNEWVRD